MTHELLPPGGGSQPPLTPPGPGATDASGATRALPQADAPDQPQGPYTLPQPPGSPLAPNLPTPVSGTNGLAIAALCCGLAGFVPLAAVVAIVLGIAALRQLRRIEQGGRSLAISGIVLGSIWTLLIGGVLASAILWGDEPRSGSPKSVVDIASDSRTPGSRVRVDDLEGGDCFDGLPDTDDSRIGSLTLRSCTGRHEAQAVTTLTLPDGPWTDRDTAAGLAADACADAVDPLLREEAWASSDLVFVYPDSALAWRLDRGVVCIMQARPGRTLDHSVLKNR